MENLTIITGGGGWNGAKGSLKADPIDKSKFIEDLGDIFGFSKDDLEKRIWDNYGMTEKAFSCAGHWDNAIKEFIYSTNDLTPKAKVIAIDVMTGELVKKGEGLLRVICPYGNEGAPTTVIQVSDNVEVVSTNKDGTIKEFKGIRRISTKDVKGGENVDKIGCAGHLGNINIS